MKPADMLRYLSAISILILLMLAPSAALADTVITVDSNCSLANAIRSANGDAQVAEAGDTDGNDDCETGTAPDADANPAETGQDTIELTANVTLGEALPEITTQLVIDGKTFSVSGDDAYPVFRISGATVTIQNMTVTKGATSGDGAGIYIDGSTLTLSDSKVTESAAGDIGGGIYATDSDVNILDTEISKNETSQSHGGGIYFVSSDDSHTLTIGGDDGSSFKENTSAEDGGGLKIAGGTVNITKSTFHKNTSDEGGGIESSGATLTIKNSTFSNNSAREGGGLSSFGSHVVLTHTTWAYNSAEEQGGGIAIIGWLGSFKIRNTLITDSVQGGDCHSGPNPDIITEFTGNYIKDGSCGQEAFPTPTPTATLLPTTAPTQQGAQTQALEEATPQAQPTASPTGETAEAQHVSQDDHDQVNLGNPQINQLTGSPAHHPLQWGSPAIDTADPAYCLDDDQPGTTRPQYDNCDIGAYEYPKSELQLPTETPDSNTSSPDATPSGELPPGGNPNPNPGGTPNPAGTPNPNWTPNPNATPNPNWTPTPTGTPHSPKICVPNERILVHTFHADLHCEEVDLITLDKHPALQGGRFGGRLWRTSRQCMHRVVEGDNLYRLAIQYDTTAESLRSLNGLTGSQLNIGQFLLLPRCVQDGTLAFADTEICFQNQGNLVFIDTSVAPPEVHDLEEFELNGETCAAVDRPGIVVLTAIE